jgi:hypothetical protein
VTTVLAGGKGDAVDGFVRFVGLILRAAHQHGWHFAIGLAVFSALVVGLFWLGRKGTQ